MVDLNDNQLAELRKLAKEIICPYARNNKCEWARCGEPLLPSRWQRLRLGCTAGLGVGVLKKPLVGIGALGVKVVDGCELTRLGHFSEEECVYG